MGYFRQFTCRFVLSTLLFAHSTKAETSKPLDIGLREALSVFDSVCVKQFPKWIVPNTTNKNGLRTWVKSDQPSFSRQKEESWVSIYDSVTYSPQITQNDERLPSCSYKFLLKDEQNSSNLVAEFKSFFHIEGDPRVGGHADIQVTWMDLKLDQSFISYSITCFRGQPSSICSFSITRDTFSGKLKRLRRGR